LYFLAIIAVIAIILITVILLKPWQKSEAGPDSGVVPGTAPIAIAENNFNESARATPDALANIEEIRAEERVCDFIEYRASDDGNSAYWTLKDFFGAFVLWQPFAMGELNPNDPVSPPDITSDAPLRVYKKRIKYADGFEIDVITGYKILEKFDPALYDSYARSSEKKVDFLQVQMADFFPWSVGYNSAYIGSAEYERYFKVEAVNSTDHEKRFVLRNMMWGEGDEQRLFNTELSITADQIVDLEENFILLKKPLVIGAEWANKVVLDDKEYIGVTRIKEFIDSVIITETHVSGVPALGDRTLCLRQAFEPGQGLIFVLKNVPYSDCF
ncbi:MAG TPA: hypothetical protein DD782_06415, partial [Firmicutes bacterium]|nr:hypothetical protein [Bacillota bacterium]